MRSTHAASPAHTGRVPFLDEWRGLCVILMIFYHGAYDLRYVFGFAVRWFHSPLMDFTQFFIAGGFIFIAGISGRYARNNIRRGLTVLGAALLMTLGTLLFMPSQLIVFGVLHCLGSSMLLYGLLERFFKKMPPLPGMVVCFVLYLLTRPVSVGYIGLGGQVLLRLPRLLYAGNYLFPFGFIGDGFFSSDYFSLLPWFFWFLAGSFAGALIRDGRAPAFFHRSHIPPLAAVGRRAMPIYILHQPVLYGALWLWFRFFTRFS